MKYKAIIYALLMISPLAMASPKNQYELIISNHQFQPAELVIPANTKVKIVIHNKDKSFEEFHSDSLHREKVIGGNSSGIVNIGPLAPGAYPFMGEFHAKTAQGRVIAR